MSAEAERKDYSPNGNATLGNEIDSEDALRRIRTAGSISISPELFEKIYLNPQNKVKGDLRKTFGNPTPVALVGFLLSLTPLSCILMGWRGSGGLGASDTGAYFFFGGLLMVLGGILEFVLGNTFPSVVFSSFGAFWFTYGATLVPSFNASGAYDPTNPTNGASTPEFAASLAFFLLWMGVLCLVYLVCALRTNIVFIGIFATLVPAFGCLAGAFWQGAQGNATLQSNLTIAGGAFTFVTCVCGWWIFTAQMLAAVDFPIQLPVGDVSHLIKGYSEKAAAKGRYDA